MKKSEKSPDRVCDVLIAGAGLAGLAAAIALRPGRLRRRLLRRRRADRRRPDCRVARSLGSVSQIVGAMGVDRAATRRPCARCGSSTIRGLCSPPARSSSNARKSASTPSAGTSRTTGLADALAAHAAQTQGLERMRAQATRLRVLWRKSALPALADGRLVAGSVIVGADGRNSPARHAAGLQVRSHRYPQSALTAVLRAPAAAPLRLYRIPYPRRTFHLGASARKGG